MLAHVSLCVCSQLCQITVKSCQPPPSSICNPPLSSLSPLFLPISLSDEQIELLNELFLWAPNAHLQLSICSFPPSVRLSLPPSTHPSTTLPFPNHTLISPAFLLQQCLYLQALKHMRHLYNALMCAHIIYLL